MDLGRPMLSSFTIVATHFMLAPLAAAGAQELKPKFGNIGGVYYTEVQGDREACGQAIKNMIALCRQASGWSLSRNRLALIDAKVGPRHVVLREAAWAPARQPCCLGLRHAYASYAVTKGRELHYRTPA